MNETEGIGVLEASMDNELLDFIYKMRTLAARRNKVKASTLELLEITKDRKRGRCVWFNVNNPGGYKDHSTLMQPEHWNFRKIKEVK